MADLKGAGFSDAEVAEYQKLKAAGFSEDEISQHYDQQGLQGLWFKGEKNDAVSPLGKLDQGVGHLTHAVGNAATRGALRLPSAIVAGIPTLVRDVGEYLTTDKKWSETTKANDWLPAISGEATDKLFADRLGLYDREDPKDWTRYPARIGEFALQTAMTGGTNLPAQLASGGSAVGSRVGQDISPNDSTLSTLLGLAGAFGGAAAGSHITAPQYPSTPTMETRRAQAAAEGKAWDDTHFDGAPRPRTAVPTEKIVERWDTVNNATKDLENPSEIQRAIQQLRKDAGPTVTNVERDALNAAGMKGSGPVSTILDAVADYGRLPNSTSFWDFLKHAGKKSLSHGLGLALPQTLAEIASPIIDAARSGSAKTRVQSVLDAIRTQHRLPPSAPIGINAARGGVGLLQGASK
jgi:hypothetical protein